MYVGQLLLKDVSIPVPERRSSKSPNEVQKGKRKCVARMQVRKLLYTGACGHFWSQTRTGVHPKPFSLKNDTICSCRKNDTVCEIQVFNL